MGPLVAANCIMVQNTRSAIATSSSTSRNTSTSSPTASTFAGGTEKLNVGLAALTVTGFAVAFALKLSL